MFASLYDEHSSKDVAACRTAKAVCAFERGMCAGRQYVHLKQSFNEFMPVWKPVLCLCMLCAKYYLMHVCTQCKSMMHQT